jgi:hypothetical protein
VPFDKNNPSQPLLHRRRLLQCLLWALSVLLVPSAIFGQENGKVFGNVTDPQGNPISDASVSLTLLGSPKELRGLTKFRGAVLRPFYDGRVILSTEFLIANGYTGQTTEVFAFPTDPTFPKPVERIVGVPLKSYITFSFTYHFAK